MVIDSTNIRVQNVFVLGHDRGHSLIDQSITSLICNLNIFKYYSYIYQLMLLKSIHRYTCKGISNIYSLHNNKTVLGRHFLDIWYMQETDYNFRFVSGYIGNQYCREKLWHHIQNTQNKSAVHRVHACLKRYICDGKLKFSRLKCIYNGRGRGKHVGFNVLYVDSW